MEGGPPPPGVAAAPAAGGQAHRAPLLRPFVPVPQTQLAGSPSQSFHDRLNQQHARTELLGNLLWLAMHIAFAWRSSAPSLSAFALAWNRAMQCLLVASIAWRVLAPNSHLRCRPFIVALLRLTSLGLGVGIQHVWHSINGDTDAAAAATGEALGPGAPSLGHAARLLFASCSMSLIVAHSTMRTRPSLSFLAQLVLVVTLLPATRAGCRGPALAHPAAQRSTHALYGWLSWVGTPLPLPLAPFSQPEAIAECTTIMTFAQIAGGLLLPMLVEALAAAAAFQQHQQQRAAAGLPAERGMHACFYASVWDVCGEGELHMGPAISPLLLAWLLLAVTWDWCSFFLARG